MKKLLLTFFSLILLGTTCLWGGITENPRGCFTTEQVVSGFITTSPTLSFNLDTVITFTTIKDESGNSNGKLASSNTEWRTYYQYGKGPLTISAKKGYWIHDVTFTYKEGADAILVNNKNDVTRVWNTGDTINILGTSRTWYTGHTKGTGGYLCFTKFKVVYYKLPTKIDMDASMTVEPKSVFKIGQILPYNAYQVWSSTDESKVSVDQNGVITAKEVGSATIKVTFGDGTSKSCVVKVETSSDESVVEDFKEVVLSSVSSTTVEGKLANWEFVGIRRNTTASPADILRNGQKGARFNAATTAHYATKSALEGGIMRISFYWNSSSPFNENNHNFIIAAGNEKDTVIKMVVSESTSERLAKGDVIYTHDFNVKQNATLSITNNQTARYLLIGNIKVTPYLLYKTKFADAYEVGYKNTDLINNIPAGETVAYTLENNDGVAEINPSTGEITQLLKDGTVTVKASWNEGKVYTTYQLRVHVAPKPVVSFTDGKAVTKSMNVVTYTNELVFDPSTPSSGCGAVTYSSDNKAVATVDNNGLVSIVGEGTANILVHIAQGTTYAEKDTSYALTVEDPKEDAIIEDFKDITFGAETIPHTIESALAEYEYQYARRRYSGKTDFDTLQNGAKATWFNFDANAHLTTTDVLEGGIKRVSFLWNRISTNERIVEFIVSTGAELQTKDTVTVTTTGSVARYIPDFTYNHNFLIKGNSKLSINRTGAKNGKESHMLIGDIKITPYIYYMQKDTTVLAKDYATVTFINDSLINNTGSEGSITYAIEEAASKTAIAEILDANSGAVTIHGAGTVKVIATWSMGATTSYTLHILKEKPTVTLEGATIDAFGSYTPAPVAKLNGVDIENPVFSYKSSNELVATVDNSGVVTIHGTGTTNIRAILAEGDNYRSDSVEAELRVNEPVGANYWKETFDSVPEYSNYVTDRTVKNGNKAVYQWQMRNFQRSFDGTTDKVDGEQGIRVGYAKSNYLAFNRNEEGGIQAVFFKWRLAGSGTADKARFSRIMSTKTTADTLNIVRENISKGPDYTYSYAETLNYDQNSQFQVRIPQSGESVIFGPMTFKPYLLYTTKDTTINVLEYNGIKTFANDKVIDNTGAESDDITYSIKSVTPAGAAEILPENAHNGQVTINGAGTAVVQAKWGEVTTTYTLRISGGDLILSFARSNIDTTMNAETFTNELSGVEDGAGALTYSSDNVRVAKVDKNTGVVSAMGPGDATITANVAAGTLYKAASTSFTVHVDAVVEDSIEEKFPDYQDSPWLSNATKTLDTVHGQLGDWGVLYARHKTTDQLPSNERAVWFNTDGYIVTNWAEGGIKRVSFNYEKLSSVDNKRFAVIAGDIHDTIIAEAGQQEYTYNHNFFIKQNDTLKIHNISESAAWPLLVGTIKITPYLYYSIKADTIRVSDYQKTLYTPGFLIDNTNGGTITYSSSNPAVATVTDGGSVKPLKASDEPVVITAKWKVSDTDSVTTSFSLKINDKQARVAQFTSPTANVERGETPNNPLLIQQVFGDSDPDTVFVSSDTTVAKIAADKKTVLTVGPGTTTITAQIGETDKCMPGSASYTLTVTYTPEAGTFWKETFSDAGNVSSYTNKTIKGDDGTANKWNLTGFMRHTGDVVGTERGIRLRYSGSIASNIALEGGVKEVVFNWHPYSSTYAPHFYVQVGDSTDSISRPKAIDASKVIPYAHSFGDYGKSNTSLTIGNFAEESPEAQGYVVIGELNVIPYLLYTRKDTTLTASQMGGVYTFTNDSLINNTGDEVAANFTYTVRAKDNAVSIANEHSGQLTIIGAGTDTIQAAWEGVTTTYVVHVNLEDANLAFAKAKDTVLVKTATYQQEATATSTATKKYELEGEHGAAEIDPSSGLVTFNEYTGPLTIMATIPVVLPYGTDTARYELQVNNFVTPTVIFNDTTVTMNNIPFVRPVASIPASGMGQAHYTSDDKTVATVAELTGLITIVGAGDAIISVHYDEGTEWGEKDVDFKVTVTDPMDDAIIEKFTAYKDGGWTGTPTTEIERKGDYFKWNILRTRRKSTDLIGTERATIFNPDATSGGYIESQNAVEGGIKRIGFNWSKNAVADGQFQVIVGLDTCTIYSGSTKVEKETYNHNFLKRENATLKIFNSSASTMYVGEIKITPYLYYKVKNDTIKVGESYKNESLIDNRDDAQVIIYSIIAGNEKGVASIDAQGNVSATRACELTIQAKWGEHNVTTTYHLSIVAEKTTITLVRDNGTSEDDVIDNYYRKPMPQFTLPTRVGYRFNAYWTAAEGKGNRFTVTTADAKTVWVAKRWINPDSLVDNDRNWIYEGTTYTFYAEWRPERTIILDNQEATTAGTDKVVTAYCPNNNLLRLTESITKPKKTNYIFQGYYTEANGQGVQLIDNNGAFKASVEGYTDKDRWFIKDADITLYAHWIAAAPEEITGEVQASTLDDGRAIIVKDGGNLLMDATKEFGNVTVEVGGKITMQESNVLSVTNFVLKDSIGNHKSGQVIGVTNTNLVISGDAFFDITLGDNANPEKWHAFAVPFNVDAINGIYGYKNSEWEKVTNEKDYAIMDYHGDVRATGAYGWKKFRGVMTPGVFYLMTVNGDIKTFRFKMNGTFSAASNSIVVNEYASSTGNNDNGWNGISNSQLAYVSVDAAVQVLNPASYTYEPKTASSTNFTVGTPFFFQAGTNPDPIVLNSAIAEKPAYAPNRAAVAEAKDIAVSLANANYTDHLYISATEGASSEYQIGRDLTKMTMTSAPAVPQIFALAYNTKLCMVDAPMAGDEAHYYLSLYAPKTGEYTLSAAPVAGYEVFLTLNGDVVWNLSKDSYIIDLEKGTNEDYGLILTVAQTTTDIENSRSIDSSADRFTKFIYDERLIIVRDGKIYNGVGALVK